MFKWFKKKDEVDNKPEELDLPIDELEGKEDEVEEEIIEDISEEVSVNEIDAENDSLEIDVVEEDSEKKDPKSNEDSFENFEAESDLMEDPVQDEEIVEEKKAGFFQRLKSGLQKTRDDISHKLNTVLGAYVKIDDEMLEDIEEILITADISMETTMEIVDNLRQAIIDSKVQDPQKVIPLLKEEMMKYMNRCETTNALTTTKPTIMLVIGVNGVGKTTTIGKLASKLKAEGKNVLLVAADTFRAAAIDQLKMWGDRSGVPVIANKEGSDPAAVIYDGIQAAKSRNVDVLICDTAGRLHNKSNLMNELEKINRIIEREFPESNRENILVLDATTGQNAIIQAKNFKEVADITGIALTKLDGTAKGGVALTLQGHHMIPIKLIGVGERIDDLQDFNTEDFINAIFE